MAVGRTCIQYIFLLTIIVNFSVIKTEDEVVISQGKIQGITLTSRYGRNFSAFRGIPYGQPPIGLLRFKNPLPADSWNGTFVADTDGNQCPQLDKDSVPVGHEDCLYLNVYTPKLNSTVLYPTMVFIHGGDFVTGNNNITNKSPRYFMDRDIVLVVINYRLGVIGFLSTGDIEASGNFGLKDQVLALRWVKENIKAFSGDPDRVTLFGQSAGSASVNLHTLSDASNGLFNQVITQSGSSLVFWAYHDITSYKKKATDLGEYLNCPTNNSQVLINCLRKIDIYTLINTNDIFSGFTKSLNTWVPTNEPSFEGAFLTTSPLDIVLKKRDKNYPWITGNVLDEGLVLTALFYTNGSTLYETIVTDIEQFLKNFTAKFIDIDNIDEVATNVYEFYFKDVNSSDKNTVIKNMTNLISDVGFLFPVTLQMCTALQRRKSPFYFYSFEYEGTFSGTMAYTDEKLGVMHSDDLIYTLPSSSTEIGISEIESSQSDNRMVDIMIDLWTSFAYNGIPSSNYSSNPNIWQPFDGNRTYLQIGKNSETSLTLKNHFHEDRMHFWIMQLLKVALKMV